MILKLCAKCGALTENPKRICDRCAERLPAMQRERHAGYDKLRDPVRVAFYHSAPWKRLRLKKLQDVGWLCEECVAEWKAGLREKKDIQLATDVHHREPITENWARRLDYSNLKADCAAHHNAERSKCKPPGVAKIVRSP